MDAPVPPGPAAIGRAGKAKLSGRSPLFYAAFAAGVGVLAWQIRKRESQTIPAPGADAVPGALPPEAAVGSFQGYSSPEDMQGAPGFVPGSQLQGTDVLSFVLDWQAQRYDYYLQQQSQQIPEPAPVVDVGGGLPDTGGGLPDASIPNPPPPVAQPRACPAAFPHHNASNGPPAAKSCYKDCGHDECKKHKRYRQHAHCYQNGRRVVTGTDPLSGRC